MFSCEFCEISQNTFFTEHLWMTASTLWKYQVLNRIKERTDEHSTKKGKSKVKSREVFFKYSLRRSHETICTLQPFESHSITLLKSSYAVVVVVSFVLVKTLCFKMHSDIFVQKIMGNITKV